jgi:hypothetical protein
VEFLVALLVMTVVLVGTGVVLTRRAVRAVRRHALRVLARLGLAARAQTLGSFGEVARVRRDLHRSMTSARRALAIARSTNLPVGDVASLLARMQMAAGSVDAELQLLETLRDPGQALARLAGPRSRAAALMSAAAALTEGLVAAAGHESAEVSALHAECVIEARALRAAAGDRAGQPGSMERVTRR